MRFTLILLVSLLVLTPTAPAAAMDEPDRWFVWSNDGEEATPRPAGGDIDAIHVGATFAGLHIKLTTLDAVLPPLAASSELRFDIAQGGSATVRFAWDNEPALWIDDQPAGAGWEVSEASDAYAWHVKIPWAILKIARHTSFVLQSMTASTGSEGLIDQARGWDLQFQPGSSGSPEIFIVSLRAGMTLEGPDFAGGTSVTIDDEGAPLLAYYIYDDTRGAERGIYMARIDPTREEFVPERLSGTLITRDNGRDAQMRTQIAHDGKQPFVLFTDDPAVDNDEDGLGHPGTPDSVYVLVRDGDSWVREDPTPDGASDVGPEDVADLDARQGRVVAAVPVGDDVWVVERAGFGSWEVVTRLDGATNAKIALAEDGEIHVAYVVYGSTGTLRDGTLYYATSRNGYERMHIGDNIDAGWEEPETDGSFAIATGSGNQVAILWNDGRAESRSAEQQLAILDGESWTYDDAPLTATHGNPQYTMRLGYANGGNLVAASGYGGTDSVATRMPDGAWATAELPRYDVWDMVVTPAGMIYFGYTQPHGGTTVALSAYGVPAVEATSPASAAAVLGENQQSPGLGVAGMLLLLGAVFLGRRGNQRP